MLVPLVESTNEVAELPKATTLPDDTEMKLPPNGLMVSTAITRRLNDDVVNVMRVAVEVIALLMMLIVTAEFTEFPPRRTSPFTIVLRFGKFAPAANEQLMHGRDSSMVMASPDGVP